MECDRKTKGMKVRRRGREILTRISLQAREESTRNETKARKKEWESEKRGKRERGRPKKELSFSPSHMQPGWLTHHYRQFINSQ